VDGGCTIGAADPLDSNNKISVQGNIMFTKIAAVIVTAVLFAFASQAAEIVPPEIQQPGTQPQEAGNFETPDRCDNCHAGYDDLKPENEPATGWRGAAMGNAGRDPIFWATLAIAEQDFDGAGDLCIRCHSASGWYAGRSTPTDASGLQAGDDNGIDCDTCHVLTNQDNSEHLGVMNSPFIANCAPDPNVPDKCTKAGQSPEGFYGSGMTSIWGGGSHKLGPYNDAEARHQFMQSKYHRSVDFCGTCHDVSNPAVGDLAPGNGAQHGAPAVVSSQDPDTGLPNLGGPVEEKAAFNNPPYAYGIVERTFSEYKSSAFPTTLVSAFTSLPEDLQVEGGSLKATYDAAFQAGTGGNYEDDSDRFFSCQSCHMRPVEALGCNKKGAPLRKDMPMHDQTGGNYWFADVVQYQDSKGHLRMGGGLSDNQRLAMDLGKARAVKHLQQAASLVVDKTTNTLKVVNLTGHKLISGYPEGRRMWLNIRWYDENGIEMLDDEIGEYGPIGVWVENPADRSTVQVESIVNLEDPNLVIYEAHYAMTREWAQTLLAVGKSPGLVLSYDRTAGLDNTGNFTLQELANGPEGSYHETFHFVLNNYISSDNRIPPYGMDYSKARERNALPVPADEYDQYVLDDNSVYEYWDEIDLAAIAPSGAAGAEIDLLYQGTSWEYIQFLVNNNNTQNAFLGAEGVNMLEAWINADITAPDVMVVNGDRKMVPPVVMSSTTWGTVGGGGNTAPVAVDDSYSTDQNIELTVAAPGVLGNDSDGNGDALTAVLVAGPSNGSLALNTNGSFTYTPNADFTGTDSFTYVAQDTAAANSNQATVTITVNAIGGGATVGSQSIQTGIITGKGKSATFTAQSEFVQGDEVIFRIQVIDQGSAPVEGATVTLAIAGEETLTLTSGPSDAAGLAEARWNTSSPNRKGQGGTAPGLYDAITGLVEAAGHTWDGVTTTASFEITP
jgi:hypothetical protein